MSHPIVSVIIPVFNTKPYLQQCLDSLIDQTLEEIEIICVDNGSTDGSYEFLQEYTTRHTNITVLRHAKGRQGDARNAGMEVARGEFIGFVDSDDFVAPVMFQKMVKAAQTNHADVAVCNFKLYYEDKDSTPQVLPDYLLASGDPFSILERPKLLRNLTIWNKLFSRKFLEQHSIRFPEGAFHEDQFFVIAAFLLARRVVSVPEALYFYRRERPGSVNEYGGVDHFHIFRVMEMVDTFIAEHQLQDSYNGLIDELKVSRILLVANLIRGKYRHTYFRKMRDEFLETEVPKQPQILTATEYHEFQIVRRFGYPIYNLYLTLRAQYGKLREYSIQVCRALSAEQSK